MTPEQFWNATPRELAAYRKAAERQRSFWYSLNASLLASLHNGPATRKDGNAWSADMFMPGYSEQAPKKPQHDMPRWKQERESMMAKIQRSKPMDKEQVEKTQAAVVMIDDRMRRAHDARQRGEPKEVIERIMIGAA